VRLSEIMSLADRLAGCEQTPADSQVYLDGEVQRVLFGIDIDVGELLLARMIGVDGVIAHHPIGSHARLDFPQVVEGHEEQMVSAGIPQPIAHDAMLARKRPIERALHSINYDRVVDAARLLRMPLMNVHLAADLIGRRVFMDLVSRRVTASTPVAELLDVLRSIPEMRASLVQPELWLGSPKNPVGRWVVQMAAGSNGGAPVFRTYYQHGINTIIAMHIDREDLRQLEAEDREGVNLIVTGHMPSDSIGINRIIDALEERGLEVVASSGLIKL
jgi:hypothetical protein